MADEKRREQTIELEVQRPNGSFDARPRSPAMPSTPSSSVTNHPSFPILAYCGSSILMTVTNKYVLSGLDFNLNFFLLMVQVGRVQSNNGQDAG